MDFLQEITQLPLSVVFCAADSFLYPVVNDDVLFFAELVNLKALVLNRKPLFSSYIKLNIYLITRVWDKRGLKSAIRMQTRCWATMGVVA